MEAQRRMSKFNGGFGSGREGWFCVLSHFLPYSPLYLSQGLLEALCGYFVLVLKFSNLSVCLFLLFCHVWNFLQTLCAYAGTA